MSPARRRCARAPPGPGRDVEAALAAHTRPPPPGGDAHPRSFGRPPVTIASKSLADARGGSSEPRRTRTAAVNLALRCPPAECSGGPDPSGAPPCSGQGIPAIRALMRRCVARSGKRRSRAVGVVSPSPRGRSGPRRRSAGELHRVTPPSHSFRQESTRRETAPDQPGAAGEETPGARERSAPRAAARRGLWPAGDDAVPPARSCAGTLLSGEAAALEELRGRDVPPRS